MASRRGRLPSIKDEFKRYNMKYFTFENAENTLKKKKELTCDDLINHILLEASHIYGKEIKFEDITHYYETNYE